MSKIVIDTNIMLYALDDFYLDKQNISINIIAEAPAHTAPDILAPG
jgi:hypothetical protein